MKRSSIWLAGRCGADGKVVMACAAREFTVLLFGLKYRRGGSALLILSIGRFASAGTGSVGSLLLLTAPLLPTTW